MNKVVITIVLICSIAVSSKAQIYAGDSWAPLPTRDLYDTGVMSMHLRALAETASIRRENYFRYSDMAVEAYRTHNWNNVIYYVNQALSTYYYSGGLYYMRGYAYEQLGNRRAAKKDYKMGVKYDCPEAGQALALLKARKRRK